MTYEWLEPKYCNEAHSASVSLPEAGAEMDCPACNPGQAMSDEQGVCEYCEEGEYSDGSLPCTQCPLHTEARKSLSFRHFHTIPDRFSTGCIKTGGGKTQALFNGADVLNQWWIYTKILIFGLQ